MKRSWFALVLAVLGVAVGSARYGLSAQDDPDKNVPGSGLPAGWQARLDSSMARLENLKFTPSGTGFRVQTGPAGIFYKPDVKPSGTYEMHATFTEPPPLGRLEAYGVFVGGSDLSGPNQKYTYFLIRQDGAFLIKRRAGASTPTVMDWTPNPAVKKADASGKMVNTLAIDVGKDAVRFLINGTQVASKPAAQVDTVGIAGLRINHNLNVQVDGFGTK